MIQYIYIHYSLYKQVDDYKVFFWFFVGLFLDYKIKPVCYFTRWFKVKTWLHFILNKMHIHSEHRFCALSLWHSINHRGWHIFIKALFAKISRNIQSSKAASVWTNILWANFVTAPINQTKKFVCCMRERVTWALLLYVIFLLLLVRADFTNYL